jgi:plasmid stabilization system protein ParE
VNPIFLPEAKEEFLDAVSYYDEIGERLGLRFKEEVDRCILWIADHSNLYRLRPGGYRRINLRAFPYYIPFILRGSTLWVLSIAHCARKPEYWIKRKRTV